MSIKIKSNHIMSAFRAAADNLNRNRELLNNLNVFPVADMDTGTNMALSMTKVAEALEYSPFPNRIFKQAADILLHKAHGNSGTILTLFFQGMAASLPADESLSAADMALAFTKGADAAEKGLPEPVEGTILSVARKAAESAEAYIDDGSENIVPLWSRLCEEAISVLPLTAIQNPVLNKYKVIDAGALGFCMILDGFRMVMLSADAGCETANAACETANAACETANASCETANVACETANASCETANASCETANASCETANVACETANASCETANVACEDLFISTEFYDFSRFAEKVDSYCSEEQQERVFRYCTELVISSHGVYPMRVQADCKFLYSLLRTLGNCLLIVSERGEIKIHIHTNSPENVIRLLRGFGTITSEKIDDMLISSPTGGALSAEKVIVCNDESLIPIYKSLNYNYVFCADAVRSGGIKLMETIADSGAAKMELLTSAVFSETLQDSFDDFFTDMQQFEDDSRLTEYLLSL